MVKALEGIILFLYFFFIPSSPSEVEVIYRGAELRKAEGGRGGGEMDVKRRQETKTDGGNGEKKRGEAGSWQSSRSLAKSRAEQLRLAAQECNWNLKPLLSPLVSHRAKHYL